MLWEVDSRRDLFEPHCSFEKWIEYLIGDKEPLVDSVKFDKDSYKADPYWRMDGHGLLDE